MAFDFWFHHEASAFVRKPLLVAAEVDAPLSEHRIDMASADQMRAYAAINPNRKFPTLRDGAADLVLWESNAIMRYLAAHYGPHLLGDDATTRARVDQWLFWELGHFGPAILGLSNLRLGFLPKPTRSSNELEDELAKLCGILDGALVESPWLAGESLTLADLAVAADFTFADWAELPVGGYPRLVAWRDQIAQRDSWRSTEARKRAALQAAGFDVP
jgi:glutathione S-transferase